MESDISKEWSAAVKAEEEAWRNHSATGGVSQMERLVWIEAGARLAKARRACLKADAERAAEEAKKKKAAEGDQAEPK